MLKKDNRLLFNPIKDGANIAWRKKEMNRPIKRGYGKHRLDWWFTAEYGGRKGVGSTASANIIPRPSTRY